MKQPMCKTCPYWDDEAPDHFLHDPWGNDYDSRKEAGFGWCMRHAPRPILVTAEEFGNKQLIPLNPIVTAGDYCGEHPDFPAYIASLKDKGSSMTPRGDQR